MKNSSFLVLLVGINFLVSCRGGNYNKQVKNFPEIELSNHWALRLPEGLHKTSVKDKIFREVFEFSNDSMIMKLSIDSISREEALINFRSTIKNEKERKAGGPCLGDYSGYYKFYNFIDTLNGLSGTILDLEENGKKDVFFRVEEFRTGHQLNLSFESLSSEKQDLVHAIVRNVKYKP